MKFLSGEHCEGRDLTDGSFGLLICDLRSFCRSEEKTLRAGVRHAYSSSPHIGRCMFRQGESKSRSLDPAAWDRAGPEAPRQRLFSDVVMADSRQEKSTSEGACSNIVDDPDLNARSRPTDNMSENPLAAIFAITLPVIRFPVLHLSSNSVPLHVYCGTVGNDKRQRAWAS